MNMVRIRSLIVSTLASSILGGSVGLLVYITPVRDMVFAPPKHVVALSELPRIPIPDIQEPPHVVGEISATSTPEPLLHRAIKGITIAEMASTTPGKLIAADLSAMRLYLFQDGTLLSEFPIKTKGKPGSAWDTPAGIYSVRTKETEHFSSIGHVIMPYSMEFYGNYFIHGWPHYPDGTPVATTYSGGCIRLSDESAQKVYAFADIGTKLFVYETPKRPISPTPLTLTYERLPQLSPDVSYLVADLGTGDVYLENKAHQAVPPHSLTALMTALVANETISFDKYIAIPHESLSSILNATDTTTQTISVRDALYPLLMDGRFAIGSSLAQWYGTHGFIQWMNRTAQALEMQQTYYSEPIGTDEKSFTTAEDTFRLVSYLYNKKKFIFDIIQEPHKNISSIEGTTFVFSNSNATSSSDISQAILYIRDTNALALVTIPHHTLAIIVLNSSSSASDIQTLTRWVHNKPDPLTACAACATVSIEPLRNISTQ